MTSINPQTRNKRIPMPERIDNFVACAVDCGYGGRDNLTRKEVYSICESTGIVYPRWLAKKTDRRISRGLYDFPELAAAGSTTIAMPDEIDEATYTMAVTDDLDESITTSDDMIKTTSI